MKQQDLLTSPLVTAMKSNNIYDYFWSLPRNWFESPNMRRGGWSGVVKHVLSIDGVEHPVFVKLQSKAVFRTWLSPFMGSPTFRREFNFLRKAQQAGVNGLEMVYYAEKGVDAILVTKSLESYMDLEQALNQYKDNASLRQTILEKLSQNLLHMHDAKIHHGCVYTKHILVSVKNDTDVDLRFIDFEKARQTFSKLGCIIKDLERFFRRADCLTPQDKGFLLKQYSQILSEKDFSRLRTELMKRSEKKVARKTAERLIELD